MTDQPPLILASTSRYRREQLTRLGLPFTALAPDCEEDGLKRSLLAELPPDAERPQRLAEELAEAKARSLSDDHPQAVIIGGDQLVACDGEILGKPGTPERAVDQLARLSGRDHRLITAIAVIAGNRVHRHTELAVLTMAPFDRAALSRYVAADAPLDCAGAYKLESRGIALFTRIACDDHSAITGLPLIALSRILRSLGYAIP